MECALQACQPADASVRDGQPSGKPEIRAIAAIREGLKLIDSLLV
mgnify:CR=1 FL=1